jgi:N-acetylglutamate synthase
LPGALTEQGHQLDLLAANAWPALETIIRDGWWLRYNEGLHRRVNSVFTESMGIEHLTVKLDEAEAFYRAHDLQPRFQVSPACHPADLDEVLAARGYEIESGVDIMVTEIDILTALQHPDTDVRLDTKISQNWLDVHMADAVDPDQKIRKARMMERITPSHVFASALHKGRTVAAGLGIADSGWLGIFGMFTLSENRRGGHGHAILAALADWSLAQGVRQAYLQVERDNPPAIAFYDRAGFRTVHGYHYRTLWDHPND